MGTQSGVLLCARSTIVILRGRMDELDFDPPASTPPSDYTEVEYAHVVPRFWLNEFADAQERIQRVFIEQGKEVLGTTRRAGTRKRFYSRERPQDGSRIDDVEWSLSELERPASRVLREVEGRWPLDLADKATLAQLFALQVVRGPRWRRERTLMTEQQVEQFRADGGFRPKPGQAASEEDIYQRNLDALTSASHLLPEMIVLGSKISMALASMHWTLIEFVRPYLAMSEHPVSIWPMSDQSRKPQPSHLRQFGLLNMLEVRVPLSPSLAVLMTWRNDPDEPKPIAGRKQHAANINAFTVAEAELEWFYNPGFPKPQLANGRLLPLSPELVAGYSAEAARTSPLREKVGERLRAHTGRGLESVDEQGRYIAEIVRVEREN
jgi:hypothetical protein